jgi:3-oxoacyl-(acyl-carrier-protein) synthase
VTPFGLGVEAAVHGLARRESRVVHEALGGVLPVMAARVPGVFSDRPAEAFLRLAVQEAVAGQDVRGVPFFVGTCSGEMAAFERWLADKALPGDPARDWYEAPARAVAAELGLGAPLVFASACTSALTALHCGYTSILRGDSERAIVAGVDALCLFAASGFTTIKAASGEISKPFSRTRGGLNFGEGAVAILLSQKPTRFVLKGTALSADAKHITSPRADAVGLERAVRAALGAHTFDLYVAHGTGTVANDAMELTLGERMGFLDKPWLAHKGLIGHAMGASGLLSMVLANEQMRRGLDTPPAYADAEVSLGGPLAGKRTALVAAAAFGGSNAAAYWEAL